MRTMIWNKASYKKILFSLFTLVILFLIGEGIGRVLYYQKYGTNYNVKLLFKLAEPLKIPDPVLGYKLNPNYNNPKLGIKINSKGLREKEFSAKKESNSYRVIIAGDSAVFGWHRHHYTNQDKTYSKLIEKSLNKENDEFHYEVLNAGVPGYSSFDVLKFFKNSLIKFEPDMFIVAVGWNDFTKALYSKNPLTFNQNIIAKDPTNIIMEGHAEKNIEYYHRKFVSVMTEKSVLWSKTRNVLTGYGKIKHDPDFIKMGEAILANKMIFQNYENNITNIVTLAQENNIKVILFNAPFYISKSMTPQERIAAEKVYPNSKQYFPWIKLRDKLTEINEKLAKSYGLKIVPLDRLFDSQKEQYKYFVDNVHYSEKGHSFIADEALKIIKLEMNSKI